MRKKMAFTCILLLMSITLVTACSQTNIQKVVDSEELMVSLSTNAAVAYEKYSVIERQQSLERLAEIFAKVINTHKDVRDLIGEEVGKQFDGDYDVLYEAIAPLDMGRGNTLRGLLQSETSNSAYLTDMIPYFNLAVPVNFNLWNTYDGEIYVIPMRYDINDMEIDCLYGFDSKGNKVAFPANSKPDFPVVVLGVNERIALLQDSDGGAITENLNTLLTTGDGLTMHKVILEKVYLDDDHEPWYSGKAEVYTFWVAGYNDRKYFFEFTDINYEKTPYYPGQQILTLNDFPMYQYFKVEFWELDTGARASYTSLDTFVSSWDGKSYTIRGVFDNKWAPDDDLIGDELIPLDYVTLTEFSFDDVTMLLGKLYQ